MTDIDELICRFRRGHTSEAEAERLLRWRRGSEENDAYYHDMVRLLEAVESSAACAPVPDPPLMADLMSAEPPRGARAHPAAERRSRRRLAWTGSAALAAAAAIAGLVLGGPRRDPPPAFSFGAGEFVTSASETATVVLGDGTVVRLAPESRLRVPGVSGSREVFLEGRAYFAVAPMPEYPFEVHTPAGEAVVLGTRFELRTEGRNLRLVVLEGRVALGAGAQQVEVEAGEMSVISKGTTLTPVRVPDVKPLVAWLERFIVFQSTPLHEVVQQLEREYAVRVEVRDSLLGEQTITGWYADRSFEEVFTVVCGVLQANCSIRDGIATIE